MTEKLPNNIFLIDTKAGIFKTGIRLRPLVVGKESVLIGKREEHYGFKKLTTDPKFILSISAIVMAGEVGAVIARKSFIKKEDIQDILENFDEIKFKDVASLKMRKTLVRDNVIDIEYNKGNNKEKLSFFVANKYNAENKETERLFNLLNSKMS